MDLLGWITGRPVRRNMIWGELDANPRFAVDDDHVPVVVPIDLARRIPRPRTRSPRRDPLRRKQQPGT